MVLKEMQVRHYEQLYSSVDFFHYKNKLLKLVISTFMFEFCPPQNKNSLEFMLECLVKKKSVFISTLFILLVKMDVYK